MPWSSLSKRQRLVSGWGGVTLAAVLVLGLFAMVGKSRLDPYETRADGSVQGLTSVLSREVADEMVTFRLEEVSSPAGIDFRHFPAVRRSLLPEDMGSGLAWGDYDDDGDPDLLLVNFKGSILEDGPESAAGGRSALYRNEGDGTFTDVTAALGLAQAVYGLGACWGGYDDDGDLDLYLSNYGPNRLYRNDGAGGFSDVTQQAGVGDERFSAGCAWADYDRDGAIDLYVTNYVDFAFRPEDRERATRQSGAEIPYTINPSSYPPVANRLYRNNGDGSLTDVAEAAGVADPEGRSLGVAWFDFDADGWIDLYVANDVSANGVYRNRGDGGFEDIGASSLAADYRGAMGLAVGDYEHDGDPDLFVTHWVAQENAFFENMYSEDIPDEAGRRRLFFMDSADTLGLGQISLRMVGWATGFADLDNDGHLDLWVANGNTLERREDPTRLKAQPVQIFRQQPSKGFFELAAKACPTLAQPVVGRGGAQADYDGDGRMDIALMVHGGRPLLLHNVSDTGHHWLEIRLRQSGGNTRALGARVSLRSGGGIQSAQVGAGGSYLSQHDTDLHFGLGAAEQVRELAIHWPDGVVETHHDLPVDRRVTFTHQADYGSVARPRPGAGGALNPALQNDILDHTPGNAHVDHRPVHDP
jgi:hypothetical protein